MINVRKTPWFLWPFAAIWNLIAAILGFTGRLVGAILGLVLIIAGIILTLTIAGAPAGIPLALVGLLLMVRSIFS